MGNQSLLAQPSMRFGSGDIVLTAWMELPSACKPKLRWILNCPSLHLGSNQTGVSGDLGVESLDDRFSARLTVPRSF